MGTNLALCGNCRVHTGFWKEYLSHRECVKHTLADLQCNNTLGLRVTGWSLGAAMGTLAMLDLAHDGWEILEAYDFGRPRVGDVAFAAAFDDLFGNRSFRVTHGKDPVPIIPPRGFGFQHAITQIHYNNLLANGFTKCADPQEPDCTDNYKVRIWNVPDHLYYMDIAIGTMSCGQEDGSLFLF